MDIYRYTVAMGRSAGPDARLLQAAGHPVRLGILRQLAGRGPLPAGELVRDRTQSTVSHHLRVLREAGWVEIQRRGTWIWYSIRPEAVARLEELAGSLRGVPDERPAPGRPAGPAWRQW